MNLIGVKNRRFVRQIDADVFIRNPRRVGGPLLESLVAHWRLDEASGVRADAHGGHDLGDVNTVGQAAGKIGDAALLEAENEERLATPDIAALSVAGTDFTLAGWAYLDASLTFGGVFGKWAGGELEYLVYFDGTAFRFYVSDDGIGNSNVVWSAGASASTWYFIVAWYDTVADQIFIQVNNGTPVGGAHGTGVFDGSSAFSIGYNEEGGSWFDGRIDSVSLWKRVLTAGERTQLYNGGNGLDYPFV